MSDEWEELKGKSPDSILGWMGNPRGVDALNLRILRQAYSLMFIKDLTPEQRDALTILLEVGDDALAQKGVKENGKQKTE